MTSDGESAGHDETLRAELQRMILATDRAMQEQIADIERLHARAAEQIAANRERAERLHLRSASPKGN